MTRFVRMLWFHLKIFARNSYFVQLLITSTLSVLALQGVASLVSNTSVDGTAWLRAGMVGTWSVCIVAAGLIGYQRFQGTLVHLAMTPLPLARVLLALVGSASSFGLVAFPLAALAAFVFQMSLNPVNALGLIVGVIALWIGCLAISSVIASIFVLTPNAITYEGLLAVPLILISGIFGIPESIAAWVIPLSYLVPTSPAVGAILQNTDLSSNYWLAIIISLAVSALWFLAGHFLVRSATKRALSDGTLEVI